MRGGSGAVESIPPPMQANGATRGGALILGDPGGSNELEASQVADKLVSEVSPPEGRFETSPSNSPRRDGEAPSSAEEILHKPGMPLPPSLRLDMETGFGSDLSRVRIHLGPDAERSARDANAEAFTAGNHIVFGDGRYAPETPDGRWLLAHELTHVVQQHNHVGLLQRLIRTPYPWQGVIVPKIGAHIRSSPEAKDDTNILDAIPKGQPVTVLSTSGNWLYVESRYRGPVMKGYIYHELVDDASSSAMEESVGATMVWEPSCATCGTDFAMWASAASETPFATSTTTVMNCWEAVLLAAYRAHAIDWNWIHNLYTATPMADWITAMSRGARHTYAVPGPSLKMPQRGDLVFFDGLAHVALATGNGSDVYTFWPPPNTPFTPGGTTDKVKVFTIEDLVAWWAANMLSAPVVEFAAPAW
jgi:hypothetical protein